MDARLVTWARAVKARHGTMGSPPPLWLFTDALRLPDPRAAVAALPRGLGGVVLRHDGVPGRRELARDLARLCRRRRLVLAVAGDWRLAAAVGAGLHLREGRLPNLPHGGVPPRWMRRLTASAHGRAGVLRGARAGVGITFVSPVFATASHAGGGGLGVCRWRQLARVTIHRRRGALGGMSGANIRRLAPDCVAIGAIEALDV